MHIYKYIRGQACRLPGGHTFLNTLDCCIDRSGIALIMCSNVDIGQNFVKKLKTVTLSALTFDQKKKKNTHGEQLTDGSKALQLMP